MEVVVDQPRHDDVVAGTDDLGVGMLAAELPVVAHRFDFPVPLQHRAVGNHVRRMGPVTLQTTCFPRTRYSVIVASLSEGLGLNLGGGGCPGGVARFAPFSESQG